jgi:NDP-sugar pyrophosphorylase family protein
MQVVVLAGGYGTRMRNISGGLPKALIPVDGVPFIDHQIALVRRWGIRRILLCTGYGSTQIEEHLGRGERLGVTVEYSREEENDLQGTGGALVRALPLLEDAFLLTYGDSYLTVDFRAVADHAATTNLPALMCVYNNDNRLLNSNVALSSDHGRVDDYSKDGGLNHHWIDYGLSWFKRSVIERYRGFRPPLDLSRLQSDLALSGELAAWPVSSRFFEIGSPDGLADLTRHLRAGQN